MGERPTGEGVRVLDSLLAPRMGVLILVPALLMSGFWQQSRPDDSAPALLDVSVAATGPFTAGDDVEFSWDATDASGVEYVVLDWTDAAGRSHSQTVSDGSQAKARIDDGWAVGPVSLSRVVLSDGAGNVSEYRSDGTVRDSVAGDGVHDLQFDEVGFTTVDTGADETPPDLTSVLLTGPGYYAGGESIQVAWAATDESMLTAVSMEWVDAAGNAQTLSAPSRSRRAATPVTGDWADGVAWLSRVVVADDFGNAAEYFRDGTYVTTDGRTGMHDLDLADLDVVAYDTWLMPPPVQPRYQPAAAEDTDFACVAATTFTSGSCATTQQITFDVAAGRLTQLARITGINPSATIVDLGVLAPPFTAKTLTGDLNTIQVADNRGEQTGWTLTATATDFRDSKGRVLPKENLFITPDCVDANTLYDFDAYTDPSAPPPTLGAVDLDVQAPGVTPGPADQSFAGTVTMCTKDAQLGPLTQTTGGVWDVPADLRLEIPVQFSKPTDYRPR